MDSPTSSLAELFEHDDSFRSLSPHSAIDLLIAERDRSAADIAAINAYMSTRGPACEAFLQANRKRERFLGDPKTFFEVAPAISALDATFWSRALALTDLWDTLPEPRREEWRKTLDSHATPEFNASNVEATLGDLLSRRDDFLAERVDGLFRALSRFHVTNQPEGFSKRLIINYVAFTHSGYARRGYIHDLRVIAAKFLGNPPPDYQTINAIFRHAEANRGTWCVVDGGAFRIRVYKCQTAHMEVHPDLAWRLNATLAHLHPTAIPTHFRDRPKRTPKAFAPLKRPLPARVLALIERFSISRDGRILSVYSDHANDESLPEAASILESLGGVRDGRLNHFTFSYDAKPVIDQLLSAGLAPDKVSHQFYPTPEPLARRVIDAAEIGPNDLVLEPSAGTGALARFLPAERTTAIELAELHCTALRGLGLAEVHQGDFLLLAPRFARCFARVVLNPPFSKGRARAHLDAASECVAPGGRLVAILPASLRGIGIDGFACSSSEVIAGAFADASVSVFVLTAKRAG